MNTTVKDPVCGMDVGPRKFGIEYAGIHYAFCSEQCQQRFADNPHLYIGMPGEKAPKQRDMAVIKQRRFRLDRPLSTAGANLLGEELRSMMGIKEVNLHGDTLTITYDLIQATAEQLEAKMVEVGVKLGEGWAERLRRGFVHYLEECEMDGLEVDPRHRHGRPRHG
ncbi:MAG: YHS domain-containing protein [Burkholderiales bacterium]